MGLCTEGKDIIGLCMFETWGASKGVLNRCCTLFQAKNGSKIIRSMEAQVSNRHG